jgi:NADPH2:quinone reductase
MPTLPITPGMELSGYVEEVGEDVSKLKVGQPVIFMGEKCYSEYIIAPENALIPIPEEIDMDAAAALPINYLTAYHMIHTLAHIEPGQIILANAAAGGVGTVIIQLAEIAGASVIGLTSSAEKVQYTKDNGIEHSINYKTEDITKIVNEITAGKGVNLILDSIGGELFDKNFEMIAPLGQIILYGMAAGSPKTNLLEKLSNNFGKSLGVMIFHLGLGISEPYPELMVKSISTLINYLVEKKIKPQIYERIPLEQASKAHKLMESQSVMGKLILKP